MTHWIFVWSPYQGQSGDKKIINQPLFLGSMEEAINHALFNREVWRIKFGDGQALVCRVDTYLGLH